jgi:hypothetical protein
MKNILFLSVILFAFGCEKTETSTEPVKVITTNFWKLDRFTDSDSKTLSQNQLNSQAQGLFGLEFEFLEDNRVRGRDKITKEIKNYGTWYLIDNNQNLDIDIIGFTGKFKVLELSKIKMTLQAANNKLIDATATVNLELIPSL